MKNISFFPFDVSTVVKVKKKKIKKKYSPSCHYFIRTQMRIFLTFYHPFCPSTESQCNQTEKLLFHIKYGQRQFSCACVTGKNKPHWLQQIKHTRLSFHLLYLMCSMYVHWPMFK